MKIREGAYYRTRGGHVFGPMVWDKDPTIEYPWHIVSTEPEICWEKRGFWRVTGTSQLDLISEVYVSDTPPDAPLPESKMLRDELVEKAALAILSGYYSNPRLWPSKDRFGDVWVAAKEFVEARGK
jgi:hypothetical protein